MMHKPHAAQNPASLPDRTCFVVLVISHEAENHARLLIESLREFGGQLRECPVWVYLTDHERVSGIYTDLENVYAFPIEIEDEFRQYFFTTKVHTCSLAEEMAEREFRSLVWLSPQSLVVNPPDLLDIAPSFDAAFRPVHIRNVGSPIDEPLDDFWREVYRAVGIVDTPYRVESFIGLQKLRPYFNSHLFSVDPSRGLLRTWLTHFKSMITDQAFQAGACQDELHKIFLHQAILSALMTKMVEWERIRILPPEYSYPLHLHHDVPEERRPAGLESLVCPVYEDTYHFPETLNGLEVYDPLKDWLIKHDPKRTLPT